MKNSNEKSSRKTFEDEHLSATQTRAGAPPLASSRHSSLLPVATGNRGGEPITSSTCTTLQLPSNEGPSHGATERVDTRRSARISRDRSSSEARDPGSDGLDSRRVVRGQTEGLLCRYYVCWRVNQRRRVRWKLDGGRDQLQLESLPDVGTCQCSRSSVRVSKRANRVERGETRRITDTFSRILKKKSTRVPNEEDSEILSNLLRVENFFLPRNRNISSVTSISMSLLLLDLYSVMSYRRARKKGRENCLYTARSLVMVRESVPKLQHFLSFKYI